MTYRESIIPKAIEAYANMLKERRVSKVLFINITEWTGGPQLITGTEYFYDIDKAAKRAIEDNDYCGTVAVPPRGDPVMLDLSFHGEVLLREDEQDKRDEEAHEREIRGRFNER